MPRIAASGSGGALGGTPANSVSTYAEVTGVASGVETTVATYTAPSSSSIKAYLQLIDTSGTNIGEFRVYVDSAVIDKKRTYFTVYNTDFDYRTGNDSSPGLFIDPSSSITVKILHNRTTTGTFNATIQVLEVG